jgi:hypothetical protein
LKLRIKAKLAVLLAASTGLIGALTLGAAAPAPAAYAASGGNFVATGHDMDLHCAFGTTDECAYFKIVVDQVRNGSTLPILAIDQGTEVQSGLLAAGYSPASIVTVDPTSSAFATTAFVDGSGNPLYSAIITASDSSCGGCDNTPTGEAAINARSADFATFFNAGGGILALAGADNFATYYNFVPLTGLAGTATTGPYAPTATGAGLGVTDAMANCCPTHNSFNIPSAPLVVLENDTGGGIAETIAAFNATIGGGGFGSSADPTSLVVKPGSGDFADPTSVSATLTDTKTSMAVPNKSVTLTLNGAETCSATTDSTGTVTCTLTPKEAAGPYTLSGSFAGDSSFAASSGTASFTVNLEETGISYTGATSGVNGQSVTLSALLTTDDPAGTVLAGKTVSLSVGSGTTAQTCSAMTNPSGVASCTITSLNQTVGSAPTAASFAADADYLPATATSTMSVFAPAATGAFVIGDKSAGTPTVGKSVYFWGSQWAKQNVLSGGPAPSAMKGFANSPTALTCGSKWTTTTGNSSAPPATLPGQINVIVSGNVTQSGSTISSTILHIVVVHVGPGYMGDPGHSGAGSIVSTVC